MASAEALRYHNLVRHGDLTSIHTLVSPSKATASAPTSPSKALILDHHKRLSLPSLDGRLPARRVRVKVMREVEMLRSRDKLRALPTLCTSWQTSWARS